MQSKRSRKKTHNRWTIRRLITEFKFKPLFVEELGWEELRSAPLTVTVDGQRFTLCGVAEKRGLLLLQCDALPSSAVRRKLDQEVTKFHREHLIVFAAEDKSAQVWLWVRREPGKPAASRERHYHRGERGERVAQMSFDLDEEGDLTLFDSTTRVKAAFDAGADLDMMLAQLRSAGKLENFDAGAQGRRGAQRENAGSFDAETQGRRGAQSKDDSSANLRAFASNGRQRDGVAAVG